MTGNGLLSEQFLSLVRLLSEINGRLRLVEM
jgi:hypothetical protein